MRMVTPQKIGIEISLRSLVCVPVPAQHIVCLIFVSISIFFLAVHCLFYKRYVFFSNTSFPSSANTFLYFFLIWVKAEIESVLFCFCRLRRRYRCYCGEWKLWMGKKANDRIHTVHTRKWNLPWQLYPFLFNSYPSVQSHSYIPSCSS